MHLDPRLRFNNFVVGSANRLAVAAARAVADGPGTVYNPLFVYSGSGLGKTHLLSAIGNHVAHRFPQLGVALVTLDELVAELHQSIAAGDAARFKARYLSVGVLLIDDMQFLTGHRQTQAELLRAFNLLQTSGKQLVMTSDRPPAEIADVDERLIARLAGGLIVDMGSPDYETRMAILNAKCEERGVRFRGGVVEELARLEFRNVRELQGALNRLIAHQTLVGGEQIQPHAVLSILGDLGDQLPRVSAPRRTEEFLDFLSGVEMAVSQHIDQWKPPVVEKPLPGPSAAFSRAGFDVSASNQLAVRAADAVVSVPATRYNPLFIHGPSGVGKTHLLHSIGHGLTAQTHGTGAVACIPAQLFVDELIAALQEGAVDSWRSRYRGVSALLLDDVQFVAGKERTQEELFHVFNALHAEGKQLVFASDRAPRDLTGGGLEERLRSRFEGGLVVAMQSPDRALRERLYARFLKDLGIVASPEMVAYLGTRPVASVREIMGTANRIIASAEVKNVPVTIAFMRAELEPEPATPSQSGAQIASADSFFLDPEKIVWQWPDASARLIEEFR